MRSIKNFATILLITILFFLTFDFILSHLGINPDYLFKHRRNSATSVRHPVYHHNLKQNLDIIDTWGPIKYRLCTNQFGFKVSCNNKEEMRKDFDIAFIGDSFTESIGTTYEDSFVGLYAQQHPDISIVNFGVHGYSPSIYFKKIEFLLDNGFTFKQLVVLPDISDIRDEALLYEIDEKTGAVINNIQRSTNEASPHGAGKNILHQILINHFMFTWYINCKIYDYFSDDGTGYTQIIESKKGRWTLDIDSPDYGTEGVLGGIRKSLEYMRKLKQLLDKHNIKMTIVVYPWPTQLFFEDRSHLGVKIWQDFCIQENCYNFIDANQFFFDEIQKTSKAEAIKKYYIHGDEHFTEAGNKAMFEIINSQMLP